MADRWHPLEKQIYTGLKVLGLQGRKIWVASSGGLDSMVLSEILFRLRTPLKFQLGVIHFYHGESEQKKQTEFRKKAFSFVKNWALKREMEFLSNWDGEEKLEYSVHDESGYRDIRYDFFERSLEPQDVLAVAHHEDDLLETRVLRLIRGVGPEGLPSMRIKDQNGNRTKIRPLLEVPRSTLARYAKVRRLSWKEDPSNASVDPLRNWIRGKWLPALEKRRKGGVQTLARSLARLSELNQTSLGWVEGYIQSQGVSRPRLLELPKIEKRQVLATYLKKMGVKNFSSTHIDEILKRVDNPKKELSFKIIGHNWKVNAEYIEIVKS